MQKLWKRRVSPITTAWISVQRDGDRHIAFTDECRFQGSVMGAGCCDQTEEVVQNRDGGEARKQACREFRKKGWKIIDGDLACPSCAEYYSQVMPVAFWETTESEGPFFNALDVRVDDAGDPTLEGLQAIVGGSIELGSVCGLEVIMNGNAQIDDKSYSATQFTDGSFILGNVIFPCMTTYELTALDLIKRYKANAKSAGMTGEVRRYDPSIDGS